MAFFGLKQKTALSSMMKKLQAAGEIDNPLEPEQKPGSADGTTDPSQKPKGFCNICNTLYD